MNILHIVRDMTEALPLRVAAEQREQGHRVTLLLLHDAILRKVEFTGPVLACEDDLLARGVAGRHPAVDYRGIVQAIMDHDRVISW
ncbi:MAG: hypothetical protein QGG56_09450 [Dehalococcoidia bacterium]|jgi:sulfur relay protein TusB/DsrH|nr:hypothetical protein [Dehalococcoidia bacterium]